MFKRILLWVICFAICAGMLIYAQATVQGVTRVFPNGFFDKGIDIPKQDGYKINFNHPYEMVETDTGYDLIIHFIKE